MAAKKETTEANGQQVNQETTEQVKVQEKPVKGVFEVLNAINCNQFTERKKDLTYLSWASAWEIVSKLYPSISYEVKHWDGRPFLYDATLGYMVETSITINGETKTMWLPVMDSSNNAMKAEPYKYTVKNPNFRYAKWNEERKAFIDGYGKVQTELIEKKVEAATMFDINTSIMRCLTKNLAMFGLGMYIYRGEDIPQAEVEEKSNMLEEAVAKVNQAKDMEELRAIHAEYPKLVDNRIFRNALNNMAKKFGE